METCGECKQYKEDPRSKEEIKSLVSRLNRIKGQIDGIKTMLEENRYCKDILIQISAAESAMRSLGYLIFEEHLASCVAQKIKDGDGEIIKETVEIVKKLS